MDCPSQNLILSGAVLPALQYVDANGNTQMLLFRLPPRNCNPMSPVPVRNDNVASDGTMWSVSWYVEGYMQFDETILFGDDLDAWLNFLQVAVNGQVLQFYPDQTDNTYSAGCRLMVGGSSNANNSNVPSGDPTVKRIGTQRFQVSLVLRFENIADIRPCFDRLNNRSEAADE